MRIIRVFPRRTKATPSDDLAYFGPPDMFAEADEIHVSVVFTWDIQAAERLAEQWRSVAPVKIGGPAYEKTGQIYPIDFIAGRYIKPGYTFTSRGCPRRCWFCSVWKRIPQATPIPNFADGWNVLDDNLLACPRDHVEAVFAMLHRQKGRVKFTGGLEALSLQDYQVGLLASLSPKPTCFFAYDPQDEFETLESAADRLLEAGFTPSLLLCLDRIPERYFQSRRKTAHRHGPYRLHANGNVVEARERFSSTLDPWRRMARLPKTLGAPCNYSFGAAA